MMENIGNVYERINSIQNLKKQLNNFKPEAMKEFEEIYKKNISSSSISNNKKSNIEKETESYHPFIKNEKKVSKNNAVNEKETISTAVKNASKKYKISEDLINAVIKTESNFDKHGVSRTGAMGLMQIMPKTALELGIEKPFDIDENVDGGTRYLKMMLDRYDGDLEKALSAYNAGPNAVDQANGIPDIDETKNYVNAIKKFLMKK